MIAPLTSRTPGACACTSGRQTAVWFLLLGFACALPIILHPLPPLLDYANHLARMHVLATIGSDRYLSQFYEVEWQIIPNLIMDAILPLPIEYKYGPSMKMSDSDFAKLAELIESVQADPEKTVVGFY